MKKNTHQQQQKRVRKERNSTQTHRKKVTFEYYYTTLYLFVFHFIFFLFLFLQCGNCDSHVFFFFDYALDFWLTFVVICQFFVSCECVKCLPLFRVYLSLMASSQSESSLLYLYAYGFIMSEFMRSNWSFLSLSLDLYICSELHWSYSSNKQMWMVFSYDHHFECAWHMDFRLATKVKWATRRFTSKRISVSLCPCVRMAFFLYSSHLPFIIRYTFRRFRIG